MRIRLAIEDKLHLQSTQPWVDTPSALLLPSGGRNFEIKVCAPLSCFCMKQCLLESRLKLGWLQSHRRCDGPWMTHARFSHEHACLAQVDAGSLPEGLHFAEVCAVDSSAPWRGPLFRCTPMTLSVFVMYPMCVRMIDIPSFHESLQNKHICLKLCSQGASHCDQAQAGGHTEQSIIRNTLDFNR